MPVGVKKAGVWFMVILGTFAAGCVLPDGTATDNTDPNDTQTVEQEPPGINMDLTGRWDMFEAADVSGEDVWDGSTLRISSQTLNGEVFDIEGRINWFQDGEVRIRESIRGTFDPRTLKLNLEGYELDPANFEGLGVYEAYVNHQSDLIYDGTWYVAITDNHGAWIASRIEKE